MSDYTIELDRSDLVSLIFDGALVLTVCGVDRNIKIELVYKNAVSRKKKPDVALSADAQMRCDLTVEKEGE